MFSSPWHDNKRVLCPQVKKSARLYGLNRQSPKKILIFGLFLNSWIGQVVLAASGAWVGIHPTVDVGEGRRVEMQAEYRNQGGLDQTLIRPFVSYPLGENIRGGTGFDLFSSPEFESRIWQELTVHLNAEALLLACDFRLRQEVRARSGAGRVAFRTRLLASGGMSLFEQVGLTLFDELFISESEFGSNYTGLDRNWLGGRLNIAVPQGTLSVGVMWEHVIHPVVTNGAITFASYILKI